MEEGGIDGDGVVYVCEVSRRCMLLKILKIVEIVGWVVDIFVKFWMFMNGFCWM